MVRGSDGDEVRVALAIVKHCLLVSAVTGGAEAWMTVELY